MGFGMHHIVSNRNNRNLQRKGNRSFKTRRGDFFNRDIKQSEKPLHDQYAYIDRTAPLWKRVLVLSLYLILVGVLVYGLFNVSIVDVEGWLILLGLS